MSNEIDEYFKAYDALAAKYDLDDPYIVDYRHCYWYKEGYTLIYADTLKELLDDPYVHAVSKDLGGGFYKLVDSFVVFDEAKDIKGMPMLTSFIKAIDKAGGMLKARYLDMKLIDVIKILSPNGIRFTVEGE